MPFRLTNAPVTFQALINDTLRELLNEGVLVYLNNILIYRGATLQQHKHLIKNMLQKLTKRQLRLHPRKCKFHQKEIVYLGHLLE